MVMTLEETHLVGERGLTYMQNLRGFGQVQVASNYTKQLDPVEVHGCPSRRVRTETTGQYRSTDKNTMLLADHGGFGISGMIGKILDILAAKN